MKVLKFGGTSVANAGNILLAENIIKKESLQSRVIVVVSALHSVTDTLIKAAEYASLKNEKYIPIIGESLQAILKLDERARDKATTTLVDILERSRKA